MAIADERHTLPIGRPTGRLEAVSFLTDDSPLARFIHDGFQAGFSHASLGTLGDAVFQHHADVLRINGIAFLNPPPKWLESPPRHPARQGLPGWAYWHSTIACRPAENSTCGCRASGDSRWGPSAAPNPRRSAATRLRYCLLWCANQVISS